MQSSFHKLKWSLQALAQEPAVQLALFPDYVAKADELALDFDNALRLSESGSALSPLQTSKLDQLDRTISSMSGQENAPLWTELAILSSSEWQKIRALALEALQSFGWPADAPPTSPEDRGTVYVKD